MSINHIFVFTNNSEEASDELVSIGLCESEGRVHPGQGTMRLPPILDHGTGFLKWKMRSRVS